MKNINISEITSTLIDLVLYLEPEDKIALLKILQEKGNINKRKSDRIPYFAEIDFSINGRPSKGYISNISESGIFVQSFETPSEGETITMAFPHPERKKYVKRKGMVVRSEYEGFAIEFEEENLSKKYDLDIPSDLFIK
ncbi:MAG: hypothetical protein CSA18_04445 [Deltaproteobacteria bacterium]|nr:MAG: hypothetical protein CSA18_04445 [Deltaproteobacteria bacterium]